MGYCQISYDDFGFVSPRSARSCASPQGGASDQHIIIHDHYSRAGLDVLLYGFLSHKVVQHVELKEVRTGQRCH